MFRRTVLAGVDDRRDGKVPSIYSTCLLTDVPPTVIFFPLLFSGSELGRSILLTGSGEGRKVAEVLLTRGVLVLEPVFLTAVAVFS